MLLHGEKQIEYQIEKLDMLESAWKYYKIMKHNRANRGKIIFKNT